MAKPVKDLLAKSLEIGLVELNVANLDKLRDFYHQVIGLEIVEENKKSVVLGSNGQPVLKLTSTPKLKYPSPEEPGLYHIALLFDTQSALAVVLVRFFQKLPQLFAGPGDHLVSESFYFIDPEGNGLELTFDRPRTKWQYENGQIVMGALYIDPTKYIQDHFNPEVKEQVKVGHLHLKVGDIEIARQFYVDVLGFNITAQLPGALFVSVGGYHHHLAFNTWESKGMEKPLARIGLKSFELVLPKKADLVKVEARLKASKIAFQEVDGYLALTDPWDNQIKVRTA